MADPAPREPAVTDAAGTPVSPAVRTDDYEERLVGDLRIRIDRTLCVGFADCVEAAPGGFVVAEDGIAVFVDPARLDRASLVSACDVCPVDAITVWDQAGTQIVP